MGNHHSDHTQRGRSASPHLAQSRPGTSGAHNQARTPPPNFKSGKDQFASQNLIDPLEFFKQPSQANKKNSLLKYDEGPIQIQKAPKKERVRVGHGKEINKAVKFVQQFQLMRQVGPTSLRVDQQPQCTYSVSTIDEAFPLKGGAMPGRMSFSAEQNSFKDNFKMMLDQYDANVNMLQMGQIYDNERYKGSKKMALLEESKWLYTRKLEHERYESEYTVKPEPTIKDSLEASRLTNDAGRTSAHHGKENSRIMRKLINKSIDKGEQPATAQQQQPAATQQKPQGQQQQQQWQQSSLNNYTRQNHHKQQQQKDPSSSPERDRTPVKEMDFSTHEEVEDNKYFIQAMIARNDYNHDIIRNLNPQPQTQPESNRSTHTPRKIFDDPEPKSNNNNNTPIQQHHNPTTHTPRSYQQYAQTHQNYTRQNYSPNQQLPPNIDHSPNQKPKYFSQINPSKLQIGIPQLDNEQQVPNNQPLPNEHNITQTAPNKKNTRPDFSKLVDPQEAHNPTSSKKQAQTQPPGSTKSNKGARTHGNYGIFNQKTKAYPDLNVSGNNNQGDDQISNISRHDTSRYEDEQARPHDAYITSYMNRKEHIQTQPNTTTNAGSNSKAFAFTPSGTKEFKVGKKERSPNPTGRITPKKGNQTPRSGNSTPRRGSHLGQGNETKVINFNLQHQKSNKKVNTSGISQPIPRGGNMNDRSGNEISSINRQPSGQNAGAKGTSFMTANEGVGNEPIVNKKYGKNTQPGRGRVETKPYWREAVKPGAKKSKSPINVSPRLNTHEAKNTENSVNRLAHNMDVHKYDLNTGPNSNINKRYFDNKYPTEIPDRQPPSKSPNKPKTKPQSTKRPIQKLSDSEDEDPDFNERSLSPIPQQTQQQAPVHNGGKNLQTTPRGPKQYAPQGQYQPQTSTTPTKRKAFEEEQKRIAAENQPEDDDQNVDTPYNQKHQPKIAYQSKYIRDLKPNNMMESLNNSRGVQSTQVGTEDPKSMQAYLANSQRSSSKEKRKHNGIQGYRPTPGLMRSSKGSNRSNSPPMNNSDSQNNLQKLYQDFGLLNQGSKPTSPPRNESDDSTFDRDSYPQNPKIVNPRLQGNAPSSAHNNNQYPQNKAIPRQQQPHPIIERSSHEEETTYSQITAQKSDFNSSVKANNNNQQHPPQHQYPQQGHGKELFRFPTTQSEMVQGQPDEMGRLDFSENRIPERTDDEADMSDDDDDFEPVEAEIDLSAYISRSAKDGEGGQPYVNRASKQDEQSSTQPGPLGNLQKNDNLESNFRHPQFERFEDFFQEQQKKQGQNYNRQQVSPRSQRPIAYNQQQQTEESDSDGKIIYYGNKQGNGNPNTRPRPNIPPLEVDAGQNVRPGGNQQYSPRTINSNASSSRFIDQNGSNIQSYLPGPGSGRQNQFRSSNMSGRSGSSEDPDDKNLINEIKSKLKKISTKMEASVAQQMNKKGGGAQSDNSMRGTDIDAGYMSARSNGSRANLMQQYENFTNQVQKGKQMTSNMQPHFGDSSYTSGAGNNYSNQQYGSDFEEYGLANNGQPKSNQLKHYNKMLRGQDQQQNQGAMSARYYNNNY